MNTDFTIISTGRITCFLRGCHSQEYLLPPRMPSCSYRAVLTNGLLAVFGVIAAKIVNTEWLVSSLPESAINSDSLQ